MSDHVQPSEREEIEMLLPWYAMGTLDAADHARVTTYLAANPDMNAQLAIIEDERHASLTANDAIKLPASLTIERLMAQAKPTTTQRARSGFSGLMASLGDLFSAPTPGAVRFAAAAACVVLLTQAVVIANYMAQPSAPGYELASGGKEAAAAGTLAIAQLRPEITIAELIRDLQAAGAEIVDGPKAGGLVTLRIGPADMSEDDRTRAIERLRTETKSIAFITLQGK